MWTTKPCYSVVQINLRILVVSARTDTCAAAWIISGISMWPSRAPRQSLKSPYCLCGRKATLNLNSVSKRGFAFILWHLVVCFRSLAKTLRFTQRLVRVERVQPFPNILSCIQVQYYPTLRIEEVSGFPCIKLLKFCFSPNVLAMRQ